MFDLSLDKILVMMVVAVFLVGPNRLPLIAEKLARLTVRARQLAISTRERLREEVGDEIDDIDWKKLNPRNYDPRQIILQALEAPYDEPEASATSRRPQPSRTSMTARENTPSGKVQDDKRLANDAQRSDPEQ